MFRTLNLQERYFNLYLVNIEIRKPGNEVSMHRIMYKRKTQKLIFYQPCSHGKYGIAIV